MNAIIPAILPTSHLDLEKKLAILDGQAPSVQIDVVDGHFADPVSWPYKAGTDAETLSLLEGTNTLPYIGTVEFEMDLMVEDPQEVMGMWITAGAARITIHAESTRKIQQLLNEVQVKYGHSKDFVPNLLSVGIALNIRTELSLIEPFLENVEYVQFMGIANIGKQGQPFDTQVLRRIAAFKKRYPKMCIQVDGGVSLDTAPALLSLGVDRLIVGSALWRAPDVLQQLELFNELVINYGHYA